MSLLPGHLKINVIDHYHLTFEYEDEDSYVPLELKGELKWDGCMNVSFSDMDEHFCDMAMTEQWTRKVLALLRAVRDQGDQIPAWQSYSKGEK